MIIPIVVFGFLEWKLNRFSLENPMITDCCCFFGSCLHLFTLEKNRTQKSLEGRVSSRLKRLPPGASADC